MYVKKLFISPKIEAYIQIIVLKKTLVRISLDFQRGLHEEDKKQEPSEIAITLMENEVETGNKTTEE
ncbi:hypothetical protein NUSPORA_02991 [Nucleospora cyclopteri]